MRSLAPLSPILAAIAALIACGPAGAQERLPWQERSAANDAYRPSDTYGDNSVYRPVQRLPQEDDSSAGGASPGSDGVYRPRGGNDSYRPPASGGDYDAPRGGYGSQSGGQYGGQYGEPYAPPREEYRGRYDEPPRGRYGDDHASGRGTFTQGEITRAGHRFFGSVSQGLASAVEYVFQQAGRPNGYILGQDAGGAVVAGLRYGEGTLYTKDAGEHPVFWQGPSLGYDFGAEGSKTMVLVYNLRDPSDIYNRFGGVQGSAYLVGGVSVQFQKYGDVVLAPIRSGVGLRLGANVGYLKYTRSPTWNPF
jgi:hypothetical protein